MKLFPLDSFPPEKSLAINDQGNILTYGELSRLSLRLSETVSSRSIALVLVKNTLGCVGAVVNLMNHGVVLILVDANASSANVSSGSASSAVCSGVRQGLQASRRAHQHTDVAHR